MIQYAHAHNYCTVNRFLSAGSFNNHECKTIQKWLKLRDRDREKNSISKQLQESVNYRFAASDCWDGNFTVIDQFR